MARGDFAEVTAFLSIIGRELVQEINAKCTNQ